MVISQLVRGADREHVLSLCRGVLTSGSAQEIRDLVVLWAQTRDCRGGKGEKDLSFLIWLAIHEKYPKLAIRLLEYFPFYGYWKDLFLIDELALKTELGPMSKQIHQACLHVLLTQVKEDVAKGQPSLVWKYLAREGSHFDKSVNFVSDFLRLWKASELTFTKEQKRDKQFVSKAWRTAKAEYRRLVTKMTADLDLVEVYLCAQRADEIKFGKLASKATLKLTKALLNEQLKSDAVRFPQDAKRVRCAELFVEHLCKKGLKGGQLDPHEIVHQIMTGRVSPAQRKVLAAQWSDLRDKLVAEVKAKAAEEGLEFNPTQMVPLSDVSGSMSGVPMEVAIALGILVSEICHPAFRNMVMTFESQPRWHQLNAGDDIFAKVASLQHAPWGGSTNFEAAYDLILDVCRKHRLARADMPVLIVFSDMQFDQAAGIGGYGGYSYGYGHGQSKAPAPSSSKTMHEHIRAKVKRLASELGWEDESPSVMVYWNLRNTGGHPVQKDTAGTVMLSGFSASLLKMVLNGEALKEQEVEVVQQDGTVVKEKIQVTPEMVLRRTLDDSRYDLVRRVMAESDEGVFADYTFDLGDSDTEVVEPSPAAAPADAEEFEVV